MAQARSHDLAMKEAETRTIALSSLEPASAAEQPETSQFYALLPCLTLANLVVVVRSLDGPRSLCAHDLATKEKETTSGFLAGLFSGASTRR